MLPNKQWILYASIAYVFSSNNIRISNSFAYIPVLNILQSYLLFSVLVFLMYLYTLGSVKQQYIFWSASPKQPHFFKSSKEA
jgi:cell shape-determining protein MreD